ncbi:MAG: sel1 repeat family protein [Gammaproteobacteria bacterium]|nr:sel1 repeat family protein [Gammaproteobacteria bacterium]
MKKNLIISLLTGLGLVLAAAAATAATPRDGYDVMRDGNYQDAMQFLMKEVARGDAAALFNLALVYHGGLGGLPADEAVAVTLYRQSAEQGYPWAQEFLSVGYQEGWFGLKQDRKQAEYWRQQLTADNFY